MNRLFFLFLFSVCGHYSYGQFRPTTYTPQSEDMSILQRSLHQQEDRQNYAYKTRLELQQLIAEKRSLLHNDELEWFNDFSNSLLKSVNDAIESRNYGMAGTRANDCIGELYRNTELNAKIRTNKEYTEEREFFMRSNASYEDKLKWDQNNSYRFVPVYNDDGQLIGGKEWRTIGGPYGGSVWYPYK